MVKRKLQIQKIKENCIEEYKNAHKNIWPELLKEYKEAGFINISCFLNGQDLYVYMEYDEDLLYERSKHPMPIDVKWQEYMDTLKIEMPAKEEPLEVYRMK